MTEEVDLAGDPEMAELAREEVESLQRRVAELSQTLKVLLLPRDPLDDRNIMLEVRSPLPSPKTLWSRSISSPRAAYPPGSDVSKGGGSSKVGGWEAVQDGAGRWEDGAVSFLGGGRRSWLGQGSCTHVGRSSSRTGRWEVVLE